MNITPEQIDKWCAEPESQHLEFKRAENQYGYKEVCKYCVAIANAGGGHLLLGITDAPPRQVVGSAAFSNIAETERKIYAELPFLVRVQEVNHPQGRVVAFVIPPRPAGMPYSLGGKYLMRAGSSLTAMSPEVLKAIFSEDSPDWLNEICRNDVNADEIMELLDTDNFFALLNLPYPTTKQSVLDHLAQEKFIAKVGDRYAIRRIGALLLAKDLQGFEDVKHKAPRVIVYSGEAKTATKLSHIGERGYAVGFQGLVSFIMGKIPHNQIIKDALREESTLVPEIVIRELVANALIHQDFNIQGARVTIEIFDNRVEISNPGKPLVLLDRFIDQYRSRNENLTDILRRMGICEEQGSGIDRVIQTIETYQLPAPKFYTDDQRTFVIIYGPKKFADSARDDRIRACYQHSVLMWIMGKGMTNKSLRERFKLSESKSAVITQTIAATIEGGLIKKDESTGKSRKYVRYLPFWA